MPETAKILPGSASQEVLTEDASFAMSEATRRSTAQAEEVATGDQATPDPDPEVEVLPEEGTTNTPSAQETTRTTIRDRDLAPTEESRQSEDPEADLLHATERRESDQPPRRSRDLHPGQKERAPATDRLPTRRTPSHPSSRQAPDPRPRRRSSIQSLRTTPRLMPPT